MFGIDFNYSKKDRTCMMCINSEVINKIIAKYHFLMPRFEDIIDRLHGDSIFSKLNLHSEYNKIQIC